MQNVVSTRRSKMRKDLERLKRRIRASKESLHETRMKTEHLKASIQAAIQIHQIRGHNRKPAV